jgi:hypothetical protein
MMLLATVAVQEFYTTDLCIGHSFSLLASDLAASHVKDRREGAFFNIQKNYLREDGIVFLCKCVEIY